MTGKKLFSLIGEADPMLVVLAERSYHHKKTKRSIYSHPALISSVAAVAASIVLAIGISNYRHNDQDFSCLTASLEYQSEFNYNGNRYLVSYVYPEEDLSGIKLTNELGILHVDENKELMDKDLETNDLDGGVIYEMEGNSPNYKLIVKYNEVYYVAQIISKADGSFLDIKDFFNFSEMKEKAYRIEVYKSNVTTYAKFDTNKILEYIESSVIAPLSEAEYNSFLDDSTNPEQIFLSIEMTDDTVISMIIIPDQQMIMIDHNYYKLSSDFMEKCKIN